MWQIRSDFNPDSDIVIQFPFKAISDYNNKLKFNSLPNEIALFEKDSLLKQKRERWHEDLQKDLYIEETLTVIAEIRASQNGKGLAKKLSIN